MAGSTICWHMTTLCATVFVFPWKLHLSYYISQLEATSQHFFNTICNVSDWVRSDNLVPRVRAKFRMLIFLIMTGGCNSDSHTFHRIYTGGFYSSLQSLKLTVNLLLYLLTWNWEKGKRTISTVTHTWTVYFVIFSKLIRLSSLRNVHSFLYCKCRWPEILVF